MNKKKAKQIANHPKVKGMTSKFANEIAQLMVDQFEKARANAETNGGEFKFDMNSEMKSQFEAKGKEMSEFLTTTIKQHQKDEINRQNYRNHTIKVSIR